ncbi:hypothetical protein ACA910_008487 [Epithemia clementina (nom. ined.)]
MKLSLSKSSFFGALAYGILSFAGVAAQPGRIKKGGGGGCTTTSNSVVKTSPGFGIVNSIDFNLWLDLSLSTSEVAGFYDEAYATWTSIITKDSNGGSTSTPTDPFKSTIEQCPAGIPAVLDDLYICGKDTCIDGPGQILGQAGPQLIWSNSGLPATGRMVFDKEDIPRFINVWKAIILHEMAHVIGIGTVWSSKVSNNEFIGTNAVSVWQTTWGCTGRPPIETDGGSGTAGGHWDDASLKTELMTGYVSEQNPLSLLTTAALKDIGYTGINDAPADATFCPVWLTQCSCPPPTRRNLRSLEAESPNGNAFGNGQAKRPPLSEEARSIANAYGKNALEKAKLPAGVARKSGGLEYVGDKFTTVFIEQDGFIYDVLVEAD